MRARAALACLALATAGLGCGPGASRDEPDGPPPGTVATVLGDGAPLVQLTGDRVRLVGRGAERLFVLERLAALGDFSLEVQGIPPRTLTLELEEVPLDALLAQILDDVEHDIEVAFDPALRRDRVVALRAGTALDRAQREAQREADAEREARLAALEAAGDEERLERLLVVEPVGRAIEVLGRVALHDPDSALRAVAVKQLAAAQGSAATELLRQALDDADAGVVIFGVEALAHRSDPAVIPQLRELEQHPDLQVREAARGALETLESPRPWTRGVSGE